MDTGGGCSPESGGWYKAVVQHAWRMQAPQSSASPEWYLPHWFDFCLAGIALRRALAFFPVVPGMALSLALCPPSSLSQGPALQEAPVWLPLPYAVRSEPLGLAFRALPSGPCEVFPRHQPGILPLLPEDLALWASPPAPQSPAESGVSSWPNSPPGTDA